MLPFRPFTAFWGATVLLFGSTASGFGVTPHPSLKISSKTTTYRSPSELFAARESNERNSHDVNTTSTRRNLLLTSMGIIILSLQQPAHAAEEKTIWLTGKAPKVPGEKPRDKNDTKGTRKDPNFLRSISDCKSQCENTPGPDGYAKAKEDCLSECQDICCTTYEQCTFAIVPRI